jgi:hypothetical protein
MNICEQAEALRLLLLMGVIDKSEIISWADGVIDSQNAVPGWLLDVSLSANEDVSTLVMRLRDLPGEWDRMAAAYIAFDRFAREFQINGKFTSQEAAHMLESWAGCVKINPKDLTVAMMPSWLMDEIPRGHSTDQHVIESIRRCIAHFAAIRTQNNPPSL